MKILMKFVSVVCHPLLMATYTSFVLFSTVPELFPRVQSELIMEFLLVIAITTCVMPAISIYLLRTFRYISNLELTSRSERLVPFTFIAIYYLITSYLFWQKLQMGNFFLAIILGATVLILLLLFITLRIKISIHATAIWYGVGILAAVGVFLGIPLNYYLYVFIVAAGLTGTSRIYLGYHTSKEVWQGTILGFLYGFLSIGIFLKIQ